MKAGEEISSGFEAQVINQVRRRAVEEISALDLKP